MFSLFKSVKPNKFTKDELTAIRNTFNPLIKKYDDYNYEAEWLAGWEYETDPYDGAGEDYYGYGGKAYVGECFNIQLFFNQKRFSFKFYKSASFFEKLDKKDSLKKVLDYFGYKENETNKEILAKIILIIEVEQKLILPKISIPIYYRADSEGDESLLIQTDESKDSFKTFSKYYESL